IRAAWSAPAGAACTARRQGSPMAAASRSTTTTCPRRSAGRTSTSRPATRRAPCRATTACSTTTRSSSIEVDDDYLSASIRRPDEHIAAGYAAGTMPSYDSLLDDDQVAAIVAYIRTLSGEGQ